MHPIKLSERLKRLAAWIPNGSILADIGSDHAYLPTYAIQEGKIIRAIAGEVNQGPYESALETVETIGLSESIDVRKGDGLQVLTKGEAQTIIVAGMGGSLIRSILDKDKDRLTASTTLILQPNNGEETLRDWLFREHWEIKNEYIIEEDGHIYEAMLAQKTDQPLKFSPEDRLFGPYLRQEKNAIFIKKWKRELEKWERIYEGILSNQTEDSSEKKQKLKEIGQRIKRMEAAIQ